MTNFICNKCGSDLKPVNHKTVSKGRRFSTVYKLVTRVMCLCGCKSVSIQRKVIWTEQVKSRNTMSMAYEGRGVKPFVNVIGSDYIPPLAKYENVR